jgi:hypothetical protein
MRHALPEQAVVKMLFHFLTHNRDIRHKLRSAGPAPPPITEVFLGPEPTMPGKWTTLYGGMVVPELSN